MINNNPELWLDLKADFSLTQYLEQKVYAIQPFLAALLAENKPVYIIEELCLNELTKDLRPSKFNYIRNLLEEEFGEDYLRMTESGIVTYEIINMVNVCKPIFETAGFSEEKEGDRELHYAVTGAIKDYLESNRQSASSL